jgi:hypothetical protein
MSSRATKSPQPTSRKMMDGLKASKISEDKTLTKKHVCIEEAFDASDGAKITNVCIHLFGETSFEYTKAVIRRGEAVYLLRLKHDGRDEIVIQTSDGLNMKHLVEEMSVFTKLVERDPSLIEPA